MEDIVNKERRQQYLALLFSGFTSLVALYLIQTFHPAMPLYSIHLVALAINVNNIFFFYKLLDLTEMHFKIKLRNKWGMYLLEFTKLAFAFFVTSIINYHAIMGPIFNQSYGPKYLYTFLAFAIPAAAISRIIFELRQARELTLQLRVAQAEAQYNLLEAQMQPHFLFNSLNVLSELIYADPDLACSVTQQLADLYREILTNSKQNFSNLGSEISILRKYIQIQKIRFGERIQFRTDVNPDFYSIAVPSLILQTLVENAIKHGISPRQEGGEIELTVLPTEDGMYEICISNTGQLYQVTSARSHQGAAGLLHPGAKKKELGKKDLGTGLQNTKNRLDLFYGRSHGFRIYSDDKKTYVRFKVNPGNISAMESL